MNLETFAVNFSEKLRQKASKIESLLFYNAFEEPKRELLVFYSVMCVPSLGLKAPRLDLLVFYNVICVPS